MGARRVAVLSSLLVGVSFVTYVTWNRSYFPQWSEAWFTGLTTFSLTNVSSEDINTLDQPIKGSIVNPHPFEFLINQEGTCRSKNITSRHNDTSDTPPETEEFFSIIYVHSSPQNFKRRLLIRDTWGNCSSLPFSCKLLFFLGLPEKPSLQDAIRVEAETYEDIIQEDFMDNYHNLSHKAVGAMKWISEFCPRTRFIVKSDDDMFVNTIKLFRLLDTEFGDAKGDKILCNVWTRSPVLRSGRWKVAVEELARPIYPPYCSGSTFVLTGDLAPKFFLVSQFVPFVWVDDAFLTGFLPLKLGNVTFVRLNRFYSFVSRKSFDENIMFVHTDQSEVVREFWVKAVSLASSFS